MKAEETPKVKAAEGADVYEVGFHVIPSHTDTEALAIFEALKGSLQKKGATLIAEEAPKRMTLAYTMARPLGGKQEKFKEAYFSWVKFEMQKAEAPELEAELKRNISILRFILITTVREAAGAGRKIFSSDRLEGETIKKRQVTERKGGSMTEEELDKTIDELVAQPQKAS